MHYSFVEYGGNNITHWSFLESKNESEFEKNITVEAICNKIFLITDKDGANKLGRQQELTSKLGDKYYCLKCREIENLLTPSVIKNVIKDYEKVSTINQIELETDFKQKDYTNKPLGKFIENQLPSRKRRGSYSDKSGTVADKIEFCRRAIEYINEIGDLSPEAKDLCSKIYNFIKKNNEYKWD